MMRTLTLALTLIGVGTSSLQTTHAADKDPLAGTWTVVKSEEDGKPQAEVLNAKFTFKDGNKVLIKLVNEPKALEADYKLDSTKKPNQIDLTIREDGKLLIALGIFELDGDKLKLCVAEPEVKERPAEFKSTGRKITVLELTRDK